MPAAAPSPAAPIGVFDSGVGGLSILSGIHALLPVENLLYVADSAHAPYGPKGEPFIRARCEHLLAFMLVEGVKAVVVACNTATAAAVAGLRARHALPIIAIEPALKPAAARSRSGVVGVLATSGTIASDRFLHLQNRVAADVQVLTRACPGLVEEIERPVPDTAALDALLQQFIEPLLARGADTLVLGCTHYSLIRDRIQAAAGPDVAIIDAGTAVARELQRRLQALNLLQPDGMEGKVRFMTSGDPVVQRLVVGRYWGTPVAVEALP